MSTNQIVSPKIVALVFGVLVVSFAAAFYAVAWQEPTQIPPQGNAPTPLNIGNLGQSKEGGLILNTGGALNGLIVSAGAVGIGTSNPGAKLEVSGDIKLSGVTPMYKIINIADPDDDADVATKKYVDEKVTGSIIGGTLTNYGSYDSSSCSPHPECHYSVSPCPVGWTQAGLGYGSTKQAGGGYNPPKIAAAQRTCFRTDKNCLSLVNYGTYNTGYCQGTDCHYSVSTCPVGWTQAGLGYNILGSVQSYTGVSSGSGEHTHPLFFNTTQYDAYRTCFICSP